MNTTQLLYFDYQASTPTDLNIVQSMEKTTAEFVGNPHGTHLFAYKGAQLIAKAKQELASLIGADTENIIFTSGATESNNHSVFGVLAANKSLRRTILISAIEHPSVFEAAYYYAGLLSYTVETIPVDATGRVDIEAYKKLLTDDVCLVSVMHTNNEIGVIQDIKLLADLARKAGAVFHCDAAQALTASAIDVDDLGVDLLSVSSHKMYGPQGIGALYISSSILCSFPALLRGGGQQDGLRSGTVPVALCHGFGLAAEILNKNLELDIENLVYLRNVLLQSLDDSGIAYKVNGSLSNRHPGNLNICFYGQDAEQLLIRLQSSVAASTGSACHSGFIEASRVLTAIGLSEEDARASVRFSFGRFTSDIDIKRLVALLLNALSG